VNDEIARFLKKTVDDVDAVIIEDYGKGVINGYVLQELVRLAHSKKKIVAVDPKEDHFPYYRRVTTITPNRKELENAVRNLKLKDTTNRFVFTNDTLMTDEEIDSAARVILEYLELDSMLVTLGEHGMKLFEQGGKVFHIPTVAQEVFDVSGAGDTVIACFSLALACQATKRQAAYLANCAAGIVVSKLGTAVTSRAELWQKIRSLSTSEHRRNSNSAPGVSTSEHRRNSNSAPGAARARQPKK
jgi:rfaE bifunctional protein kinase chain/domain